MIIGKIESQRDIGKDEIMSDKRQRRQIIIGKKEKDRELDRYIGKMKQ